MIPPLESLPALRSYDPGIERRDVAVRALARLVRWGWWRELAALGLPQDTALEAFQDEPFPKTERMVFEALARCPALAPAAEELLRRYISTCWQTRQVHYRRDS